MIGTRSGLAWGALAALAACGDVASVGSDGSTSLDGGGCTVDVHEVLLSGGGHVPQDSALEYVSNPPAGGDHYPEWLRWARRYDVVPRGNYIHNLEHGGVVLINPCATGCDAVSDALESIGRSLQQDTRCTAPINARWLVARDPLLEPGVAVAAVAWGWVLTAPCFDEGAIRQFIADHYAQTFEDICFDGSRP